MEKLRLVEKKSERQVGGEIFPGVQGVTWSSTVLELHVIVAVREGMQSGQQALWHFLVVPDSGC